jgi:hypothetical protein
MLLRQRQSLNACTFIHKYKMVDKNSLRGASGVANTPVESASSALHGIFFSQQAATNFIIARVLLYTAPCTFLRTPF